MIFVNDDNDTLCARLQDKGDYGVSVERQILMSPSQRVPVVMMQRARHEVRDRIHHERDTRG